MSLCTKTKALIHRARNLWTVKVRFGAKLVTHYAKNEADAAEWAACYGTEYDVLVLDFHKPYAARLSHRDGAWVRL